MCPGKLKNIPDSHKHRSQVRHLSQTEVGSVEKEDRSSSQIGAGAIARGTLGSFLSMQHSCKQRDMWPQVPIQSLMQAGLWLFLQWFPGRAKFPSLEPRKLPQCGSQPEWEGLPDPLAGHSAEQQECFHCQGHLLGRFFPWSLPPAPIFSFLALSLGCSLMPPLPHPQPREEQQHPWDHPQSLECTFTFSGPLPWILILVQQ